MNTIEKQWQPIYKALFRTDGVLSYDQVTDAMPELCEAILKEPDNDKWLYIGECTECCLADFIVGAYWHYTEWHGGQYSNGYAALCALGRIFSPGMSSCEDENEAYIALNKMARGTQ